MSDPPVIREALRLLRRELRGGPRGFGVFLGCLFLGVFAISAIGSFSASARSGLLAEAGALLGGDLEIRLAQRELSAEQKAFVSARGTLSTVDEMRSMAATLDGEQRTLVELKAVGANYPLYGALQFSPPTPLAAALEKDADSFGALAEASLLQRLDLRVGDRLQLGEALFRISGVLTTEPDRALRAFTLGPRLLISQEGLAATALLQPGSLVTHAYRLRLPDRDKTDAFKQALHSAYPQAGWRLRTWQEAAPRVQRLLDRVSLNLTLIGLCALLVGGLGVSGAVRGYLESKVLHIAAMKCLGASGRLIFTAYLLQILFLGALGAGAGLACGAALPFAVAELVGSRLPIPLEPAVFPEVLGIAALYGLLIALAFSLIPLGVARRVPPAVLFRGYVETGKRNPGLAIRFAVGITAALLGLQAVLTSSDHRLALWFILGACGCFILFRLFAAALIRALRRLPRFADPRLRLGLANIHRPGSPAAGVLFSLGLGLTALVIIAQVQANLDDLVNQTLPAQAPAFFFMDIQPDQVAAFEQALASVPGVGRIEQFPTLRGRITEIKGVPVEQAPIRPEVNWAVMGDRFLSYSAKAPAGTNLTAGAWWPENYSGPPLLSLTADLAAGFGVGIGDTLTVNVLGREITAKIASLRQVDWSTLELNFALLFAPGALEGAPKSHLAAVHVAIEDEERVFRAVTGRFPNISAIPTREVLSNLSRTIDRIGGAFKAMAAVTLLSGFLVLSGAVSADQHRRIHDAVIFKVCGATRADILISLALEFLILGLAAGALSAVVGSLAAMGIVQGPMKTAFTLHPLVVLATLGAGIAITLTLGLLGTWKALGHKPAAYLQQTF